MYSIILMMSMTSPSQAAPTDHNLAAAIYRLDVRVTALERRLAGPVVAAHQPAARASCAGAAYAPMPRGAIHSRVKVESKVVVRTGIFAERRPVRRIFGIILAPIRGRGCGG